MRVVGGLLLLAALAGCSRTGVERVEWPVMGTVAAVQWRAAETAAVDHASVRQVFARVEKLLNAHDPDSELNRLRELPDAEILQKCDPLVRPCYAAAFKLRDQTDRRFNPRWRGPGTMDLGAIAKGFAVDLAAGHGRMLVDLGGNLKACGGDWQVGILGGGVFTLEAGAACATSARYFRGNHIKDGRDGGEIAAPPHSVTVVHPSSAMLADGLSTVMFLLGREKGEQFLRRHYPEARAIWVFE